MNIVLRLVGAAVIFMCLLSSFVVWGKMETAEEKRNRLYNQAMCLSSSITGTTFLCNTDNSEKVDNLVGMYIIYAFLASSVLFGSILFGLAGAIERLDAVKDRLKTLPYSIK